MAIADIMVCRYAATQTQTMKADEGNEILVKQRLNRPVSPHLGIYRPQITWYLSSLNRITGVALSGGFYLFFMSYLASPLWGGHMESVALVQAFGSLGPVTKAMIKFTVALPFTFHSFNGIRHLVWDTGRAYANTTVIRTGWTVVGLSVVSAGLLAAM